MTLEFEGNLSLERAHHRRWVSIIAVVIPVAAFILFGAWFIRVYVAPPTVAISNPMMLMAAAPPAPPAIPKRAQVEALPPPITAVEAPQATVAERMQVQERVQERVQDKPFSTSALPMFATLATAPPSMPSQAYADPAQDSPSSIPPVMSAETPAELAPPEPMSGVMPLPRAKPHGPIAAITTAVPLPRPRPTEATPEPDPLAADRHSIN